MDPEVVRRLRDEADRLHLKAAALRARDKRVMAAQEQLVADDLRALLADWERQGEAGQHLYEAAEVYQNIGRDKYNLCMHGYLGPDVDPGCGLPESAHRLSPEPERPHIARQDVTPTARELLDAMAIRRGDSPRVDAMLAARVERVLTLHYERGSDGWCDQCDHDWPCPTVRALNGEDV